MKKRPIPQHPKRYKPNNAIEAAAPIAVLADSHFFVAPRECFGDLNVVSDLGELVAADDEAQPVSAFAKTLVLTLVTNV